MATIIWTKKATHQFEKAVRYINETQGKYYAEIVLNAIFNKVDMLETHPLIGTKEPKLAHKKSEYRYLVVWSYKIIYRLSSENQKVTISRVFHTSQHPRKLW